jgi:DNA-binding NarL/FixJ family response regulator
MLRVVRTTNVHIILITVSLADDPLGGLTAIQQIRELHPETKCVTLFEASEAHLVVTAFRAGAKGVFFPGCDGFARLCRCVEKVHAGQIWANSAQLQELLDSVLQRTPLRLVSATGVQLLTKREEEVVQLVEEGLTNRQIAAELGLSEHTVRNNLFRIFDKLGVSTRVELALYTANSSRHLFTTGSDVRGLRIEALSSKGRSLVSVGARSMLAERKTGEEIRQVSLHRSEVRSIRRRYARSGESSGKLSASSRT